MQPANGDLFRLTDNQPSGRLIDELAAERIVEAERRVAALESIREHGPLVVVPAKVAHAQRLGQREQDRRQRRRKTRRS